MRRSARSRSASASCSPAARGPRSSRPYAGVRLWLARLDLPAPLAAYLDEHGSPIRYGYVPRRWPLSAYQNVYAVEPGSAEMPSAGRPFTTELITRLVAGGVLVAPIVLHTGVSSQERHERPYPERYRVPEQTARLVNAVHALGRPRHRDGNHGRPRARDGRRPDGVVEAGEGWTNLIVTPERGVRAVDGLITGLHELESSHLDLLRAIGGERLIMDSYNAALEHGYRWHEFGDSQLILGRRLPTATAREDLASRAPGRRTTGGRRGGGARYVGRSGPMRFRGRARRRGGR